MHAQGDSLHILASRLQNGLHVLRHRYGIVSEWQLHILHNTTTIAKRSAMITTGTMGLLGHLSAGEIVEQLVHATRVAGQPIKNIVFMGMGIAALSSWPAACCLLPVVLLCYCGCALLRCRVAALCYVCNPRGA